MKLKYFIPAFVAVLAMLVSCSEDQEPTLLDEVQVSSSYVAIPVDGGNATITVNAKDSWTIDAAEIPAWLTVSPTSGSAGESKVTFSAEKALDGRTAVLHLTCAGATQTINVIQGLPTISPATCAEVIAGPDSKNYQVTGVCTKIANTQYGNWYLQDETGEVYIYGTVDSKGAYNWASFGIEVGDMVTVQGPKTTYNGTVELVDVTVVKVQKSLIKVESVDPENATLSNEGGDFTVNLSCKGNGISVEVPEDAQSWLAIKSINGTTVVFHAAENNAGPRATTLTFNTTDGKKSYSCETTLSQEGRAGTLDLPMTVEEAIAAAKAGVTNAVYVKGIVTKLYKGGYDANYGNGTFWISADGTSSVSEDGKTTADTDHDFEVYQANWFGGAKWTADNAQIAEGAEVIVYAPLTVYNGVAETQGKGAGYVHSVNGVTTDANGIGTLDAAFNCVGAIKAARAGIQSKVYVLGIVSELVKGGFDANYGNGSFWMSDTGEKIGDLDYDFEAYQVNYLGGAKWTENDPQIGIFTQVLIYGPLTTYNGTSETQGKGAAYIVEMIGIN